MSTSLVCPAMLGAMGALVSLPALALPQNGTISAGAATIQQTPSAITVNQYTDRAVIDWKSFDIAPHEAAKFNQPSVSSIILNRIHDRNPSQILGNLSANGKVVLVNPNGMVFGKDAKVDVAGLVATTADISNQQFMHGRELFFDKPGSPDAKIVNQGSITIKDAGLAALVAPEVTNEGVIAAKGGNISLASGTQFTLDLYGDKLVSVAVDTKITKKLVATNNGALKAEGGNVLVTTAQAREVIDSAINMNGLVDVSSAQGKGGKIVISGKGVRIAVGSNAVIKADGAQGGGEIKIGGDYLGTGDTPHASTVTIAQGGIIIADATAKGDGGEVIVWSDERTQFDGRIQAKGGPQGGNGGFIETSSKDNLVVRGLADASAPKGAAGQWLLDPSNVTIANGAGNDVSSGGTFNPATDNYAIDATTIQTALNNGTSVTITTVRGAGAQNGDITITGGTTISKTAGGDATLTLKADNNIVSGGASTISSNTGKLNLTLWADADNSGAGGISLTDTAITTNGGDVVMGGGLNAAANPARGLAGTDAGISLDNADITTAAGNITLRGRGDDAGGDTNYGVSFVGGSTLQTTSGNITVVGTGGNGANFNHGVLLYNAGTLITSASGAINISGTGGNGSADYNLGVVVDNSGSITSTGTATITISGTGGNGAANNFGFWLDDAASAITTVDGDIVISGTGGAGSSNQNYGLQVEDGTISATGSGDIAFTGVGGVGTANNHGVWIHEAGTVVSVVTGTLTIHGTAGDSAGSFDIGAAVTDGAVVRSTGAGAGAITITGIGGDTGDNNWGVLINDANTEITSVSGNIIINGTGGAGNDFNYGIYIENTADIISSGTANITITGTGGGGNDSNFGILLEDAGSTITAVDGDIALTGRGGGGGANSNSGVFIDSSGAITTTGAGASAGNITITGTGGAGADHQDGVRMRNSSLIQTSAGNIVVTGTAGDGTGNWNEGVWFGNGGMAGSTLTTATGSVTISGTGGAGTGNNNVGFALTDDSVISITGVGSTGTLTINGVGRGAGGSTTNYGIILFKDTAITSAGTGAMTLTGQQGVNSAGLDIWTDSGTNTIGGGAYDGDLTINFDNYTFNTALDIDTAANIILQPRSTGTTVGVAGGAGGLNLSNALLAFFSAGDEFIIGRTDGTGDMHVNTKNWGATGLHLRSSTGIINIDGAQTLGAGEAFTITSNADTNIGAAVTGTGILTLQTSSAATTMGIAGGAGAAAYSVADLNNLGNGWSSVLLGNTTTTGALTAGAYTWADPVTFRADPTGSIVISGNQTTTAASNAIFTFSGPATLNANVDSSAATGGTRAIVFSDTLSLGADITTGGGALTISDDVTLVADSAINTTNQNITFATLLNGAFDLDLTTTGNVTFTGAAGGTTRLSDVTITNAANVAGASFKAASFTETGGTGTVAFGGAGLDTTGAIDITANNNITGTYTGVNGTLDAGAGTITATVSFTTLDVDGAGAILTAGYIGAPGAATQAMANLISVSGQRNPWPAGLPNAGWKFDAFQIGAADTGDGGGGGGGGSGGAITPVPETPPVVTPPTVTPPVVTSTEPDGQDFDLPNTYQFVATGVPLGATLISDAAYQNNAADPHSNDPGQLVRIKNGGIALPADNLIQIIAPPSEDVPPADEAPHSFNDDAPAAGAAPAVHCESASKRGECKTL